MSDAILPKSRNQAEHESYVLDIDNNTAQRVVDKNTHNKLDEVITAIESITIDGADITVSNEVEIKNDVGSPVPVSASSLPLPTGAATETTTQSILDSVDGIEPLITASNEFLDLIEQNTDTLESLAVSANDKLDTLDTDLTLTNNTLATIDGNIASIDSKLTAPISTTDVSNAGGVQGSLTVTTSAVIAKVGASNLANRKTLTIYNNSLVTVYWGYTSGLTTSNGTPLFKDQIISFEVGPSTDVYLIAPSGSRDMRVTESA